jgi:Homeodomain-like domain
MNQHTFIKQKRRYHRILDLMRYTFYDRQMPLRIPFTAEENDKIKLALMQKPCAVAVARESKGAWSYSKVWRIAHKTGIELTEGRKTMGHPRLSAEKRAEVLEACRANPGATQQKIAELTGVGRASVSRIKRGVRRVPGGEGTIFVPN